jgi:hypothetical protein
MAVLLFPKNGQPTRRSWSLGGVSSRAAGDHGADNVQTILDGVTIELDEDDLRRLIDAVGHYEAYLHSQHRDETQFRQLLLRLRKMLGSTR